MKIYRAGRTSKTWQATDTKSAIDLAEEWKRKPDGIVPLDGTIEKEGQRHTDVGITIEADDIIALSNVLMRSQQSKIAALQSKAAEQAETIAILEETLGKLKRLLQYHRKEVTNCDALMDTVQNIAEHYYFSQSRSKPMKIDWVDWDSI